MKRICRFFGWMMVFGIILSVSASAADIDILACPEGCNMAALTVPKGCIYIIPSDLTIGAQLCNS